MSATILLADDSPTIQKVVELTFAETPHQVVAVSSGSELLARLPEVNPDVVICDVIMPDRDGYDICQTIKSSPETLHIPVILLTGTFEPFDRDRALAVGCDDIVTKPFEARQLIAAVEKLVSEEPTPSQPGQAEEEQEYGTFLVAPPAAEISEGEAPSGADQEAPAPAAEAPAAAERPGEAFPSVGPEGEEGIPEEGLDFTTTGFAEMEAAGEQPHVPMAPPAEGLEIEEQPAELPLEERIEASGEEASPPEEDLWTGPEDTPGAPADTAPVDAPEEESPAAFDAGESAPQAAAHEPEPLEASFGEEAESHAQAGFEAAGEIGAPGEAAPTGLGAEGDLWPEAEVEPSPEPETPDTREPGTVTAPMPIPPPPPGSLSDQDVDRIARRVVELFRDRLEQIAWEVIPDMAEIVVRERVQELEEEIEAGN